VWEGSRGSLEDSVVFDLTMKPGKNLQWSSGESLREVLVVSLEQQRAPLLYRVYES
jgi:hypothetical protein